MALFEGYERRIDGINKVCAEYGIASIEAAADICKEKGIDPAAIVTDLQPICFENAKQVFSSERSIAARLPWPKPTLR